MRVVTFRMPYLFGSGVGIQYSLDRDDKFDCIVGSAEYEEDAQNLVERVLWKQGVRLDHNKWSLAVSREKMSVPDQFFERTLAMLRSIGLNSYALRDGGVEIFAVSCTEVDPKKFAARGNCPPLELP